MSSSKGKVAPNPPARKLYELDHTLLQKPIQDRFSAPLTAKRYDPTATLVVDIKTAEKFCLKSCLLKLGAKQYRHAMPSTSVNFVLKCFS